MERAYRIGLAVHSHCAVTFPLALALGTIMQKTDSIWGSILLHAGLDIPVMLGISSNL
jgi:membrane protease YdiL (CAAX protease family)